MGFNNQQYFNYDIEKRESILCIDMKSFYASVECVERGENPLKALLVVMSGEDTPGGLALSASPMAKKILGITNVTRKYEIPYHKNLLIVPPRMNLYLQKNMQINNIFRRYVGDEDIWIYSVDETFVRVNASQRLFQMSAYEFAKKFQQDILNELGLYCTIGIGDNMLLSKLALDNAAKYNQDMIATWHYEDVPNTVWQIPNMTDFWGINKKTEKTLKRKGIDSIYDLAHYDFFYMKDSMGVIGQQLIAHAWGIDRTDISNRHFPKSKSIGNSQVLTKDYTNVNETKIVLKEMAEQVAARLRNQGVKTACIHIGVGYSRFERETGFSRQMKIPSTNLSKDLVMYAFILFDKFYKRGAVRNLAVHCSKLSEDNAIQLNLFDEPEEVISTYSLDKTVDKIRRVYGFSSIIHASSLVDGATAVNRASLVGGHAGGMEGITWS